MEQTLSLKIEDHVDRKIDQLNQILTRVGDDNAKQLRLLRNSVLREITQEAKFIGHLISHFK